MPPTNPLSDIYNLPLDTCFYADTCTIIDGLTKYTSNPGLHSESQKAMAFILQHNLLAQSPLTMEELYHALRNSLGYDFANNNGITKHGSKVDIKKLYENNPHLNTLLKIEFDNLTQVLKNKSSFLGFDFDLYNNGHRISEHIVNLSNQFRIDGNDIKHLLIAQQEGLVFVTTDRDFLKINDPTIAIYVADSHFRNHSSSITTAITLLTLPPSVTTN